MPDPTPITILLDPRDDAAVTRTALAAHDPRTGRLTIHPTPATTSTHALADDLLQALNTPAPDPGTSHTRRSTQLWSTVAAQITTQHITHVIILRAHLMSRPRWTRLLDLQRDTGIALTLICHGHAVPAAGLDALRDLPHRIITDPAAPLPPIPHDLAADRDPSMPAPRPCCPVCGRIPHLANVGRPPTYCETRCRKLAHRVHTTARRTAETAQLIRHQLSNTHTDLTQAITAMNAAINESPSSQFAGLADAAHYAADIARHAHRIAQLAREHDHIYTEHRNATALAASLTTHSPASESSASPH